MKNILRIFISDLRGLFSNFFSIVIILAMLVLPALYAWVNIYANWDPYANTGNIQIALSSADAGYTTEDGTYVNHGRETIEEIAESTSISWVIVDDPAEAVARVIDGTYYGALVMEKNMSRNMHDIMAALRDEEPSIIFYQNAKTNAIANKITNTAANTVKHNIQVKYLSVLIENVLKEANGFMNQLDAEATLDDLIRLLTRLRDSLRDYANLISGLGVMDPNLIDRLEGAKNIDTALAAIDNADMIIMAADAVLGEARDDLRMRAQELKDVLTEMEDFLNSFTGPSITTVNIDAGIALAARAQTLAEFMRQALPENSSASGIAVTASSLDVLIARLQSIQQELSNLKVNGQDSLFALNLFQRLARDVAGLQALVDGDLASGIELIFDGLARDIQLLYNILDSLDATVNQIPPTVTAAQSTIAALQSTMRQLISFLGDSADSLDKLIEKLKNARDNETISDLIAMLHGDPNEFAEFLSSPVEVRTTTIYPVENYGSGMAPFYSTLAIWVGGVILSAVIQQDAKPRKLKNVRDGQCYWGRLLTYLLFGQVQAAIIIWGDLHLLGCQCLEPKLLYMTAAVTSLVFVTLIYSLILAFGDIGKAIMVVIMVLQIAGSSGSYPIEILPQIFSGIYLFFPFPYAINAMRETMCGMYRYDLYKYLGELLLFGVAAVLIGRVVRKPFIKLNAFIEEEMEETGVL